MDESKWQHLVGVAEAAISSGDKARCHVEWRHINDQCNYALDCAEYLRIEELAVRVYRASR